MAKRMRITRKNGDEYIGTAKIINRRTQENARVERVVRDESVEAVSPYSFDTRVNITIVSSRVRLLDPDNICGKYFIDGLRKAGIIKDDSSKYVEAVTYRQVKVKHKSQEQTAIIIEEIE